MVFCFPDKLVILKGSLIVLKSCCHSAEERRKRGERPGTSTAVRRKRPRLQLMEVQDNAAAASNLTKQPLRDSIHFRLAWRSWCYSFFRQTRVSRRTSFFACLFSLTTVRPAAAAANDGTSSSVGAQNSSCRLLCFKQHRAYLLAGSLIVLASSLVVVSSRRRAEEKPATTNTLEPRLSSEGNIPDCN